MQYPCIVYSYKNNRIVHGDNIRYLMFKRYTVTIIDHDSDSKIPDKLLEKFEHCQMDRRIVSDNLHHYIYTLYF